MTSPIETLKQARKTWPEVVTRQFLGRYVDDGLIEKEDVEQILKEK